jgi:hypothetical protein
MRFKHSSKRETHGWSLVWAVWCALIALMLAALAGWMSGCVVKDARAMEPRELRVMDATPNTFCASDSICFMVEWTWADDSLGSPVFAVVLYDSRIHGARTVDTTALRNWQLAAPAVEPLDTVTFRVGVVAIRRHLKSDTTWHTWKSVGRDVAPRPVDSLVVDTVKAAPPDTTTPPDTTIPSPVDSTAPAPLAPALSVTRGPGVVRGDSLSPHVTFNRRTFTDFCYCFDDGAAGDAARAWAARHFDLIMSGNPDKWKALNGSIMDLRYALLITTLNESTKDAPSLTGKYLDDMRTWYASHSEFTMEDAFLHAKTIDSTGAMVPRDSAHRLVPVIWRSARFVLNPADSGARRYTIDRMMRILRGQPASDGLFLDEMDRHALGWPRQSQEFLGQDSTVWQGATTSLVRELRDSVRALRGERGMVQTNAAEYSTGQYDRAVGVAAGAMHLELMNKAYGEVEGTWGFVEGLLRDGVYVDFVGAEMWPDLMRSSQWIAYPPGAYYTSPAARGKVVQLASYYMVIPSDTAKMRMLGLQAENVRTPLKPDSTKFDIYSYDVGHPTTARERVLDSTDSHGQHARVYRRDFTHAVVLMRPVASYRDTSKVDDTGITIGVPRGTTWGYVTQNGNVAGPIDRVVLRNSDAIILVPFDSTQDSPLPQ